MKQDRLPSCVQASLDHCEQQVEYLTAQLAKTDDAIEAARSRLTGGFQHDSEYRDMRAVLDEAVANRPVIEQRLRAAKFTLSDAKTWLAQLPPSVTLEPVVSAKPDDRDLAAVQVRLRDLEDEVRRLRAVPVPAPDIKERIDDYVRSLARPKVSGIASGQQLRVVWPESTAALWAMISPKEMVSALMREVESLTNTPMSVDRRKHRIAELQTEIDTLQRQAFALGDSNGLPPEVVLGVRVVPAGRASAA